MARSKSEPGTHSALLPCKYPGCTSIFYSDAGRRSHFQNKHQARRWHCKYPGCTSHFANASGLRNHERVAHVKLNWDCKHAGCTKSYASVNGLRMHVETKHNHQRFPCTHPGCTLDFSTDCNRRTHIQAQHQGRRAHCELRWMYSKLLFSRFTTQACSICTSTSQTPYLRQVLNELRQKVLPDKT
jgi:hypothetical protein